MNFADLLAKMKTLDENIHDTDKQTPMELDTEFESQGMAAPAPGEVPVEECGLSGMSNMPSGMMGTPKQQDNVTMNISMNGSGAGGIRDLMNVLKDIQDGGQEPVQHAHDDDEIVIGMEEEQVTGGFDSATTKPSPQTAGIDAVIATGDDLASKGREFPNVAGGGNPMQETLMTQLASLYQEVKLR